MRRAVGMAGKVGSRPAARRTKHCRQTQPADSPPGTGLKQTATDGRPRSETTAADDVGLPLAVQCR